MSATSKAGMISSPLSGERGETTAVVAALVSTGGCLSRGKPKTNTAPHAAVSARNGLGNTAAWARVLCALSSPPMDSDSDGTVSLEEFQAAHERIFKAMDPDKDGTLLRRHQRRLRDFVCILGSALGR
jgi:hypothetical protein